MRSPAACGEGHQLRLLVSGSAPEPRPRSVRQHAETQERIYAWFGSVLCSRYHHNQYVPATALRRFLNHPDIAVHRNDARRGISEPADCEASKSSSDVRLNRKAQCHSCALGTIDASVGRRRLGDD